VLLITTYLGFHSRFSCDPGSAGPLLVFFHHFFAEEKLWINGIMFLHASRPSCQPANSVKALKLCYLNEHQALTVLHIAVSLLLAMFFWCTMFLVHE